MVVGFKAATSPVPLVSIEPPSSWHPRTFLGFHRHQVYQRVSHGIVSSYCRKRTRFSGSRNQFSLNSTVFFKRLSPGAWLRVVLPLPGFTLATWDTVLFHVEPMLRRPARCNHLWKCVEFAVWSLEIRKKFASLDWTVAQTHRGGGGGDVDAGGSGGGRHHGHLCGAGGGRGVVPAQGGPAGGGGAPGAPLRRRRRLRLAPGHHRGGPGQRWRQPVCRRLVWLLGRRWTPSCGGRQWVVHQCGESSAQSILFGITGVWQPFFDFLMITVRGTTVKLKWTSYYHTWNHRDRFTLKSVCFTKK